MHCLARDERRDGDRKGEREREREKWNGQLGRRLKEEEDFLVEEGEMGNGREKML